MTGHREISLAVRQTGGENFREIFLVLQPINWILI